MNAQTGGKLLIDRFANVAQTLLAIAASLYIVVYIVIALIRLSYPFELEWMEGGSVVHVQRLLDGQPLYVRPSLSFIPSIYPPLYFAVSALVARVLGNGFLPLRLVSFVSSLGCFAFIFLIVRRRTTSRYAAFMASCLFAATFRIAGSWFDVGRVDSLFLMLILAGLYTIESPRAITSALISPVLVSLACFTKQTGLVVGVSLSVAALMTRKRSQRVWFPLVFALLTAGSFVVMNARTGGWYKYYVFDLPSQHEIVTYMVIQFWTADLAEPLAIALCVGVATFLNIDGTTNAKISRILQDLLIIGSLSVAAFLPRIHAGGYTNVLMPAYAAIAIYFGIGLAASLKAVGSTRNKTMLIGATALQFVALFYPPGQQIPSRVDKQQGERLEQLISGFKGEVYLSDHPWYAGRLNRPSQAQDMAVRDILRASGSTEWKQALQEEMKTDVAALKYEAFIVDFSDFSLRSPDFETHYQLVDGSLSGNAFHPLTGRDRRPTFLYVRKPREGNVPLDRQSSAH